jgi:glycosyltransferase involved in cell wall biosynthesis
MHELEVANILKRCMFFLSFSELEGCHLPPAEAMSSGCYVIGFTGNGANEYMLPEFCDVINKDDINTYIKQVKARIKEAKLNMTPLIEKGKRASSFIQNHLSKEEEKRLLIEMISRINDEK